MKLILLRHPPALGAQGLCYGRLDLAADPEQMAASIATAQAYRHLPLYSSPAQRCLQLAHAIHPQPTIWPELQELDFGHWEGKNWNAIPRQELDDWAADIWHHRPGNGESPAQLRQRWLNACKQWQAIGQPAVIAITHAGFIRMALAESGQIQENERWTYPIAHATAYEIVLS